MKLKAEKMDVQRGLSLIVKTSFVVLFGVVLSKVFGYVYRIIIAREFGAEVYGTFSIAVMLLGWFVAISSFGLADGLMRFITVYEAKKAEKNSAYIRKIISLIILVSSLIFGGALYLSSGYLSRNVFNDSLLEIYLKIFSALVPITAMSYVYLAILRSYRRIKEYSMGFNILQSLVKLVFIASLVFLGVGIISVPLSYLAGLLVMLAYTYYKARKYSPDLFKNEKKVSLKPVIFYSLPLMLFNVVYSLMPWIDTFFIGTIMGSYYVGLYNAAVPIAMILGLSSEIFMQLFLPLITSEYAKNRTKSVEELSKQVSKWILSINLPLAILFVVYSDKIIEVLFGSEFLSASFSLQILSVGAVFLSMNLVPMSILSAMGKSKQIFAIFIAGSILNVILNYLFIPVMGINGAAIATTISWFIVYVIFLFQTRKYLRTIPLRRKMGKIVISAILAGAVLLMVQNLLSANLIGALLGTTVFSIVYLIIVYFIKALDKNDFEIIGSVKNKLKSLRTNSLR